MVIMDRPYTHSIEKLMIYTRLPLVTYKAIKIYLSELYRLRDLDEEKLSRYKEECFREVIRQAFSTPIYARIYKRAGINAHMIRSIDDIKKLPVIRKCDLVGLKPRDVIPSHFNLNDGIKITTSGTTGKKLTIYMDLCGVLKGLVGLIRVLKEHGIDWRKDRLALIVDLGKGSAEERYLGSVFSAFKGLFSFRNFQILNTYDEPRELFRKLKKFNPSFIGGYSGMLSRLAILNRMEGCKDFDQLRCIISSGFILDDNMRKLIEESFDVPVFDYYGATESGPVAFQCRYGSYHIMSDLVHIEVTKDGLHFSKRNTGIITVTRLYGKGTPVVRYAGLSDVVAVSRGNCKCGISGEMIKKIYGRKSQTIFLPDGNILYPRDLESAIDEIIYKRGAFNICGIRFLQKSTNEVVIFVVIDDDRSKYGKYFVEKRKLIKIIEDKYQSLFGKGVEVVVEEIDRLRRGDQFVESWVNPLDL
ncbi:MAG: hypothetical protein DRN25_01435 [Thermoplasmata archaeon]|nr:MAG: hypothetical protein DRN25_01435 [Thermoplasmata archaeon]